MQILGLTPRDGLNSCVVCVGCVRSTLDHSPTNEEFLDPSARACARCTANLSPHRRDRRREARRVWRWLARHGRRPDWCLLNRRGIIRGDRRRIACDGCRIHRCSGVGVLRSRAGCAAHNGRRGDCDCGSHVPSVSLNYPCMIRASELLRGHFFRLPPASKRPAVCGDPCAAHE